ncbi:glutamyl-tRNA reductase [Syntrophomonas erecta]
MDILLAGVNYRTAPLEIREKFTFSEYGLKQAYWSIEKNPHIEGVVILATCNRTEIYFTAQDSESGKLAIENFLCRYTGLEKESLNRYVYLLHDFKAVEHLFRVSAGLDSMIIGETQILGQVKDAYMKAWESNNSDRIINNLFQKALYVGKKVRSETAIDQHPVSISYASVELAKTLLGGLEDKTVLVVGAGKTGELTTRYLLDNGIKSVIISNRSFKKATSLAVQLGGRAVRLDDVAAELYNADIVISCTAANHYILRYDNCGAVLKSRRGRKILFIDIAVPRDVEPGLGEIEGVYLYDIDRLQNNLVISYQERQKAALKAVRIIDDEVKVFQQWLNTLDVVPVVSSLKLWGETVRQRELKRAFNRLGKVSEREQKIIVEMSKAIVNQLLRNPVISLKEMAVGNKGQVYAEMVKYLFGLRSSDGEQKVCESMKSGFRG